MAGKNVRYPSKRSRKKGVGVFIVCAVVLVAAVGLFWKWINQRATVTSEPAVKTPPADVVQKPTQELIKDQEEGDGSQGPVIDYGKVTSDEDYRDAMEERKAHYGVDKSVDMIVKPDETIQIGDTRVRMQDILDKIRLQEEGFSETPIAVPGASEATQARLKVAVEAAEQRYDQLEKRLAAAIPTAEEVEQIRKEQVAIERTLEKYQTYEDIDQEIADAKEIVQATDNEVPVVIKSQVARLKEKAAKLERQLQPQIQPSDSASPSKWKEQLEQTQKRFEQLDEFLSDPNVKLPTDVLRDHLKEKARLRSLVFQYREYQQIRRKIKAKEKLLTTPPGKVRQQIKENMDILHLEKDNLENTLRKQLLKDDANDVYGIYVVRPGDNVWNIHFEFLKDYFKSRGIQLSPVDDEPLAPGVSSGVGKILKFSEKMVYIYNIKEKRLDVDLNLIHPLNKIVVFRIGYAISFLSQIDYRHINQIRFDGETLWLPPQD